MRRILLTGMSGAGKSTVAKRLAELGYKAVDTDYGGFSKADESGVQRWDGDRIRKLLSTEDAEVLFVVGSDEDQVLFYRDFDKIILLSAPREIVIERLASRTDNPFGKSTDELAKVLVDLDRYEPLIRRGADHEVDTNKPLERVIEEILSRYQQAPGARD